ncbi:MAG: dihydropteroate synthase [Chloroflexi bacterium]|nr:dihydropteroate synthase [Chloroflexota bacterium]|tara:strand:+ start:254 stop:1078 length:825 start_codon:yes stop_codon:yes gene_type:complete
MSALESLPFGTRTFVMGVLNVTPDSFSGDGLGSDVNTALSRASRFIEEGVDIIDVGGESTRPSGIYEGVQEIQEEEEIRRVIPVIDAIKSRTNVLISVDTYKANVALAAVNAGASIVNDIWGMQRDPDMTSVISSTGCSVVLMHNTSNPDYSDVVQDTIFTLSEMVDRAVRSGVNKESILIDPGIGFGKTVKQNLEILRRLDEYKTIGRPLLVGTSRKSTIGNVLDLPVDERLEGTAATVALAIAKGVDIVRVHDVKEMIRVSRMSDAIVRGWN